MQHGLELDKTEDGWDYSRCLCGWVGPPCPDTDTAFGFFNDHIQAEFARIEAEAGR